MVENNRIINWSPAKINGEWRMLRENENGCLEDREMNWWERIRYFYLKNDKSYKYIEEE